MQQKSLISVKAKKFGIELSGIDIPYTVRYSLCNIAV